MTYVVPSFADCDNIVSRRIQGYKSVLSVSQVSQESRIANDEGSLSYR